MDDDRYQLIGLIGFIISGLIFLAAAIVNGDWWTFAGAVAWIGWFRGSQALQKSLRS